MISNSKISNLVSTQLPFFVRNDHENFVAFLEAYYEFLEQETNQGTLNTSRNLLDQSDIDLTDIFVENFYKNFLPFIPKETVVDKTLILKKIKDFYRSRGTEKSIRFLMRILFNEEIEFYYPQRDILRASDGKWFVEKSIKVQDIAVNGVPNTSINVIDNFIGRKISGLSSNATALVEKVDTYYDASSLVREMKLSNQYKEFEFGEQITATFIENGVEKTITANLFSGGINTVTVTNPGTGYKVGDTVTIESGVGNGAVITVSSVSTGNLYSLFVFGGGAGFKVNDRVLITGGGGSGANANVTVVAADGFYHPNTYNIMSSLISLEANTQLGNTRYANLNTTAIVNVQTTIVNAVSFFTYANTGPISEVFLYNRGGGYISEPTVSAQANTRVKDLGILGRMEIVNGGQGYQVNDTLEFINVLGGYGVAAAGRVKSVNTASGNAISDVEFVAVPGHIPGGSGYSQFYLPTVNVISSNAQAYGANIVVKAVLGSGDDIRSAGSVQGAILSLSIQSRGSGYVTPPTLNLSSIGDGTAQAVATIITGSYTYPGRYLNDDGHLSAYNFLEDRDYYQTFSYVVKLKQSINKYRQALKTLVHPAGMKLFGEYTIVDNGETLNVNIKGITDQIGISTVRPYRHQTGNVTITYTGHGLSVGNTVYVDWLTGNVANAGVNGGSFVIKTASNANSFVLNTSSVAYLSNTLLPVATGTANVIKIIV